MAEITELDVMLMEKQDLSFDVSHIIDGIEEALVRSRYYDEKPTDRLLETLRDDLRELLRRLQ